METSPQDYAVYEKTLALESGAGLRYALAVPPLFSADRPYPLVLALHYGGRVTPYYGKGFLTSSSCPPFATWAPS